MRLRLKMFKKQRRNPSYFLGYHRLHSPVYEEKIIEVIFLKIFLFESIECRSSENALVMFTHIVTLIQKVESEILKRVMRILLFDAFFRVAPLCLFSRNQYLVLSIVRYIQSIKIDCENIRRVERDFFQMLGDHEKKLI